MISGVGLGAPDAVVSVVASEPGQKAKAPTAISTTTMPAMTPLFIPRDCAACFPVGFLAMFASILSAHGAVLPHSNVVLPPRSGDLQWRFPSPCPTPTFAVARRPSALTPLT